VQDAWLRFERGRNGLGADEVRVALFLEAFPAAAANPAATHQISLQTFDSGTITRDLILQFVREPTAPAGVDAQIVGEHLYSRFIGGDVLTRFEDLNKAPDGVRVWLEILEPDAEPDDRYRLADLPWEAMAGPDPAGGGFPDFLALRTGWTIVRAHVNPGVAPAPERSLRILVLTGDDVLVPADGRRPEVRADEDAASVEGAFQSAACSAHVEMLPPPRTPAVLHGALRDMQAHVVHFIGHGSVTAADRHALTFRAGADAAWQWDVNSVPVDLRRERAVPRLAVLNSCYHAGELERSTSLARAFLRAGSAAAIGMQARVRADYALFFTRALYEALAADKPLDVAVGLGRQSILAGDAQTAGANLLDRDWFLPVLTLAVAPDQVLPRAEYVDIVKNCGVRRDLESQGPFIDRHLQRRRVHAGLAPWNPQAPPARGVLVTGVDQAGKSWFVKRSLADLAQAGAVVRYCDMTGGQGDASSRDVIARLRDGWTTAVHSFVYEPLPAAPFAEYDSIRGSLQPIVDASGDTGLSSTQIGRLFEAFTKGLKELANTSRVVLVLDQFSRSQRAFPATDFTGTLLPRLLEPILQGRLGDVHVVLSMRSTEAVLYGLTDDGGSPIVPGLQRLEVPLFRSADARRLFLEYCGFRWGELEQMLFKILERSLKDKAEWRPGDLVDYRGLIQRGRQERP
jgi:hypothetical protein